ncbi:MAG: tetratricopeptide repeat protein [Candidatus Kapaibacterium sp.]
MSRLNFARFVKTATEQASNGPFVLNAPTLRDLLRGQRGRSIPRKLSDALRHHTPHIFIGDAAELAEQLCEIAHKAVEHLEQNGIRLAGNGPNESGFQSFTGLTGRERRHVVDCAALHCWWGAGLLFAGETERAVEVLQTGIAWAKSVGDHIGDALLHTLLAEVYDWRLDPTRQMTALRDAVNAADEENSRLCRFHSRTSLAHHLLQNGKLDEAERWLDWDARELTGARSDPELRGYLVKRLVLLARLAQKRGDREQALALYREARALGDEVTEAEALTYVQLGLAVLYVELEQPESMLRSFHEGVKISERVVTSNAHCAALVQLAFGYQWIRDFNRAHQVLDRADELVLQHDFHIRTRIAMRRANIAIYEKRYDDAIELLNTALELLNGAVIPTETATIYSMIGLAESERGNTSAAETYYQTAIRTGGHSQYRKDRWTLAIARLRIESGRFETAAALLEEIETSIQSSASYHVQWLHLKADLSERCGDFKAANELLRRAADVEREYLRAEGKRSFQNARIAAEAEFAEREIERERKRRQYLERELAGLSAELPSRRKLLDSIAASLDGLLKDAEEGISGVELLETLQVLQQKLKESEGSHSLPTDAIANPGEDFFRRLRSRWPNLTTKQERFCGLIRMGLDNNQIRDLLGLTTEGIKGVRKRLRKALGLERSDKLERLIHEV